MLVASGIKIAVGNTVGNSVSTWVGCGVWPLQAETKKTFNKNNQKNFFVFINECNDLIEPFQKHRRSFKLNHNCTVWLLAPAFDSHDADLRSRLGLALFDDLAFGVDRVAVKNGVGVGV
ncbi:MAG: hypothetical protein U0X92_01475 [Anaerolineales bacterium]